MRMPRVRFRIFAMITILTVASLFYGFHRKIIDRGVEFEQREMFFGRGLPHPDRGAVELPNEPLWLRRQRYNLRMVNKYHFAHRFPFLPVLPDPPEPE
jgi:hypothetical protein